MLDKLFEKKTEYDENGNLVTYYISPTGGYTLYWVGAFILMGFMIYMYPPSQKGGKKMKQKGGSDTSEEKKRLSFAVGLVIVLMCVGFFWILGRVTRKYK